MEATIMISIISPGPGILIGKLQNYVVDGNWRPSVAIA
jgi:hypothetical protein